LTSGGGVVAGNRIRPAEMKLRHMGWVEVADLIVKSMERAIEAKAWALILCA